jgi:hypothetical protein
MHKSLLFCVFILFSHLMSPFSTLDAEITSPREGQVIQGNFEIIGTAAGEGFKSAELSYAYANTGNPTWFSMAIITQPVNVAVLSVWDTTTISDGDYQLKLTVNYQDGSTSDFTVSQVLVRNYTPVEITPTTQVEEVITTQVATSTPASVEITPFPTNNAALSLAAVDNNLLDGAIIGVVCVVFLGIYTSLHGWTRRR